MKKKRHILRNTLITIGCVFALLLSAIGIMICDFTDNTPDYITEVKDESIGDFISAKAQKSLENCGVFDDFEFLFNEHEINDLLATVVPLIQIPMVSIKSIYVQIDEDDNIEAEAPFWAAFYKSCAKVHGFLSYDDTTVTLKLDDIKIRYLDSKYGIVDAILDANMAKTIQKAINDAGVELTIEKVEKDFYVTMTNLDICKTIINCTKNGVGFLSAALVAGTLTTKSIDLVVNEKGLTGAIIHRGLL